MTGWYADEEVLDPNKAQEVTFPFPDNGGGRLVYTEEQVEVVKAFFAARRKWQRSEKEAV